MTTEPKPRIKITYATLRADNEELQALYDAGEVIMSDVIVNLHGAEHRDRRRLENRLFRRDTFTMYERELFPPIIDQTFAPHLAGGRAVIALFEEHLACRRLDAALVVDEPDARVPDAQGGDDRAPPTRAARVG